MIFRKKKTERQEYDKENLRPVLKCSICNGEQVAGFRDIRTGKFQEIRMIRNDRDLEEFKEMYGLTEVPKEY